MNELGVCVDVFCSCLIFFLFRTPPCLIWLRASGNSRGERETETDPRGDWVASPDVVRSSEFGYVNELDAFNQFGNDDGHPVILRPFNFLSHDNVPLLIIVWTPAATSTLCSHHATADWLPPPVPLSRNLSGAGANWSSDWDSGGSSATSAIVLIIARRSAWRWGRWLPIYPTIPTSQLILAVVGNPSEKSGSCSN